MCGRYLLLSPPEAMRRLFGVVAVPNFPARYNVAPTDLMPVVCLVEGSRAMAMLRWGLVPAWASDLSIGARTINARSESVLDKPSFREAVRLRRCLVPADGYYEWRVEGKVRQPYLVRRTDRAPMVFAGLWERWLRPKTQDNGSPRDVGPAGQVIETFSILTTDAASAAVRAIHDRMPMMLDAVSFEPWLGAAADQSADLLDQVRHQAVPLDVQAVQPTVNNVRNDDERCLALAEAAMAPVPAPARQGSLL